VRVGDTKLGYSAIEAKVLSEGGGENALKRLLREVVTCARLERRKRRILTAWGGRSPYPGARLKANGRAKNHLFERDW